ncbi:HAMP domain-containing sensor histidine kinase [Sphingomonas sp. GlSt437]|uniref:HAMP domain-containing sensor histidine kinase n=1 Tax=Sphingomonas sp. GlSt437 TaxID=3389970 RepID=UPI003A8660F8
MLSLRARVIALVALVLLVSGTTYLGIAWESARANLHAELDGALKGAEKTVRSSFEDVPRSDHPDRDLRQLIATFDGNRHVQALMTDQSGRVQARSALETPIRQTPEWFQASLAPWPGTKSMLVPNRAEWRILLRPNPSSDLAVLWAAARSGAMIATVAVAAGLALIYWVIGRALSPLAELAYGLNAIGDADFGSRVDERGPPELLPLQRGFNAMAARLAHADERNRALEAQLLTIQDEERAEIARDLHDEIGPHLFAVALDAELIGRRAAEVQDDGIVGQVHSIQSAVSYMQRQVRELIARLRPTKASELGLKSALDDVVTFWRRRRPEVAFSAQFDFLDGDLPEPLGDVIYRVVQEATANALRHAQTLALTIAVKGQADAVIVRVRNRGKINPKTAPTTGLGIASMRERVQNIGGTLDIDRAQEGWTVLARIPLSSAADK